MTVQGRVSFGVSKVQHGGKRMEKEGTGKGRSKFFLNNQSF